MKKGFLSILQLQEKYNLKDSQLYHWRSTGRVEYIKIKGIVYMNEVDVLQMIYEGRYSLAGMVKLSGHSAGFIRSLCEKGKIEYWLDSMGHYIFPIGSELLIRDLFQKSKQTPNHILELRTHNRSVYNTGNLKDYHVAKLDDNGEILEVFLNRNQAVRAYFKSQGLGDKDIVTKYVSYNGALSNRMMDGCKWFGYRYKYVSNSNPLSSMFSTTQDMQFVVVSEKGEEKLYKNRLDMVLELNMAVWQVRPSSGYIDTGKIIPKSQYTIYTVGKTMSFNSKKQAMGFYRIGKDKFKKLFVNKKPIRGQLVDIAA